VFGVPEWRIGIGDRGEVCSTSGAGAEGWEAVLSVQVGRVAAWKEFLDIYGE
jgi:hypothetical protein